MGGSVLIVVLCIVVLFSGSVLTTFFILSFILTTICLQISIRNPYHIKRWSSRQPNGHRFGVD